MLTDLIKTAVGVATKFAGEHKLLTGLGLGALILPKLMGGGSPQAMMGTQQAMSGQLPAQQVPPQSGAGSW